MAEPARNLEELDMNRTEFWLLGPIAAWVGDTPVPVGGPRQAGVLARLLLTPRQVVSLDQFIDCIWDDQLPNRPEVAIRSYVSNLRRLLEPERRDRGSISSLMSVSAGYRLDVDPDQIDWMRFEAAVNEARGLLKEGAVAEASSNLKLAQGLWHGEALSGVPESPFFLAHRTRLEELRAVAQELTYETQLALGDHLSVAANIDQAISANPFRERLTELGMIALYRSGRQSAALNLGQQLRERLVDSLGIDPGPRIANIELQILNHDPALREQPNPPSPQTESPIQAQSERSRPTTTADINIDAADEAAETEGSSSRVRRPGNGHLIIGRRSELRELHSLSERVQRELLAVAVLTGEPGIGKTTLLERSAVDLAGPDGLVLKASGSDIIQTDFWLWRQIIEDLVDPARTQPGLASYAGLEPLRALGFVVGPDGMRPDRSDVPRPTKDPDEDIVISAIGDLVHRLAIHHRLVLMFDDLHLADQRSVDALRHLVTKPVQPPATVLMAWQQALLPPEQPHGLRELSVLPHSLRISLSGLDLPATRQLATARGHDLHDEEITRLHRNSGGNPALTVEILADGGAHQAEQPVGSSPSTTEAVVGQADRLGPDAAWILAVAGTFDGPFALNWLQEVVENPPDDSPQERAVQPGRPHTVVRDAVYRGLITELPEFGWFAFRHQAVRRTLVETLLTVDRAWYHGHFGRKFLVAGDNGHALYHLARGAEQDDRRRALDIGLRLCSATSRELLIGDATFKTLDGLAREQIQVQKGARTVSPLACRSALFLSWRANQRGDRATGQRWTHTALELALSRVERHRKQASRGNEPSAAALDDLGAAALNLTGFSPHPQPGGQLVVERDDNSLALLEKSVLLLPEDDKALPVLEIELEWLSGSLLPSNASLKKANNLLEQAMKGSDSSVAAMAATTFLRRFGRAIPAERWVEVIHTAISVHTTLSERLMLAFLEHRAMLEQGLVEEAAGLVRAVRVESNEAGSPADASAARTLAARHHLWTGDLNAAQALLDDERFVRPAEADLVAVEVEQRAELGRLLARGDLLDAATEELGQATIDPATCAALLSQAGHYDRATELLEQAVERISTGRQQQVDESILARIAMTASALFHKPAAAVVLEPLRSLGDHMLVSNNSAMLLGPASFYTGLAAATVGDTQLANESFDSAVATALSRGGKPLAIQALVAQAKLAADYTERDDVESLLRQAKELAVGLEIRWLDAQVV